jgi:hypothetical protein
MPPTINSINFFFARKLGDALHTKSPPPKPLLIDFYKFLILEIINFNFEVTPNPKILTTQSK